MREYSSPLNVEIPATGNLTDDVVRNAAEAPDAVAFSRRPTATSWEDVTAAEFLHEVRAVAKGLVAAGIQAGDRVALISKTRYEWTLVDYAIWFAGAVTVPVYETSSAEQIEWILGDSGAVAVVAEGPDHTARIAERRGLARAELNHVWSLADNAIEVLRRLGEDISDDELEAVVRRRRRSTWPRSSTPPAPPADPRAASSRTATSCSSSASPCPSCTSCSRPTTPRPCSSCPSPTSSPGSSRSARSRPGSGSATAPTSRTCCPTSPSSSRRSCSPYRGSSRRSSTPPRSGPRPRDAAGSSTVPPRPRSPTPAPSTAARCRWPSAPGTPCSPGSSTARLRAALGGRCRYAVSGGAPLGDRLGHFYRGIGLTVLEGYGLTETTAAVTVNRPDALKIGTVGQPLPGTEVRVAEDGELLFRGGQVFAGYWRQRGRPPPRCSSATAGSTPATSARSTRRASSGSPGARRRSW